jgi:glutamyl-tRNA synthetase
MGYSMPEDKEIYTLEEIIRDFAIERIGVSGAFFDVKKLDWINQQYLINHIPEEDLWNKIKEWGFNDERMKQIVPLIHTRIKTFSEFMELCQFLFINHIPLTDELLTPKETSKEKVAEILQSMIWHMEESEDWGRAGFQQASRDLAALFEVNHKKVIMPILFAVITGKHQGPPLFDSVAILGKDITRARLLKGIEFCGGLSNKQMSSLKKMWDQRPIPEKE